MSRKKWAKEVKYGACVFIQLQAHGAGKSNAISLVSGSIKLIFLAIIALLTQTSQTMSTLNDVKTVLAQSLQLGARADTLTADSPLLGALPELDSMAVVLILTSLEEHFGFTVEDDEISADTFATLGTLTAFAEQKISA